MGINMGNKVICIWLCAYAIGKRMNPSILPNTFSYW